MTWELLGLAAAAAFALLFVVPLFILGAAAAFRMWRDIFRGDLG